jgi:hypothetical protein
MESGEFEMTLQDEARVALDAKGAAERQLAKAAECPPWRHALFGLVMAALVATPVLPLPLRFGALVLILVGIGLIVVADRRRMGMFVNGYRRGKTLGLTLALLAVNLGLYAMSVRAQIDGNTNMPLMFSGVAFGVNVIGSIAWQRIFVRELGA